MSGALHLDRRADRLIVYGAAAGAPDDLLETIAVAAWFGVSKQWLEIGRHRGYGPPFLRLSGRIRYRRSAVIAWLDERSHHRTSEYPTRGPRRPRPAPAAPVTRTKNFTRRAPLPGTAAAD